MPWKRALPSSALESTVPKLAKPIGQSLDLCLDAVDVGRDSLMGGQFERFWNLANGRHSFRVVRDWKRQDSSDLKFVMPAFVNFMVDGQAHG